MRAIVFDAYGTLLHITERRDPYQALLRESSSARAEARRLIMARQLTFPALLEALGLPYADASRLAAEIAAEVASVAVYAEVPATLARLRAAGYRLAVVSNLAPPYAEPIRRLLGPWLDVAVFSFEVGYLKPQAEIFHLACARLGAQPAEVMMVGDSPSSDAAGARVAGLHPLLLDRQHRYAGLEFERITELTQLFEFVMPHR